jgi:hypothetical protein
METGGQMKVLAHQFNKAILRMMPTWASETGEGKFVAAIMTQAWADLPRQPAKEYFRNKNGMLQRHCDICGLEWTQIKKVVDKYLGATTYE